MTDKIVEKVAVQSDDSRNQGRRAFLKGSAAVAGGVLFTKAASAAEAGKYDPAKAVAPYAGKEEITQVLEDGPARKSLGFGVRKYIRDAFSIRERSSASYIGMVDAGFHGFHHDDSATELERYHHA